MGNLILRGVVNGSPPL